MRPANDQLLVSQHARDLLREQAKQDSRASRGASSTGASTTAKPGARTSLPPPRQPLPAPEPPVASLHAPKPNPPLRAVPPPPVASQTPPLQRLARLAGLAKASGRVLKPLGAFIAVGVGSQAAAHAAVDGASVPEQVGAFGRAGTNYLLWPFKPYDREKS